MCGSKSSGTPEPIVKDHYHGQHQKTADLNQTPSEKALAVERGNQVEQQRLDALRNDSGTFGSELGTSGYSDPGG